MLVFCANLSLQLMFRILQCFRIFTLCLPYLMVWLLLMFIFVILRVVVVVVVNWCCSYGCVHRCRCHRWCSHWLCQPVHITIECTFTHCVWLCWSLRCSQRIRTHFLMGLWNCYLYYKNLGTVLNSENITNQNDIVTTTCSCMLDKIH